MLRSAEKYIWDEMYVEIPEGDVNGEWFKENDLPMIVQCSECGTTMILFSAVLNDEGECYCRSCCGNEEIIER